jgi:hypothetical protein
MERFFFPSICFLYHRSAISEPYAGTAYLFSTGAEVGKKEKFSEIILGLLILMVLKPGV